ncbi:LON peptidase N-terminal domain and RING finger protein 2-like isoform X4 [Carassius auratus]|nr:LON peptidase N-terminal domain and RING finger protein 2-like isoform X4 [Carassius auratus]XP_026060061.1 LON peptidase N-terminal domain and RING finger protein 2-like isoform X4 [Carassius auratus]XP_052403042.1 LON peptidase N-terminal domain and RING finger protein 2 isoform X2 [Carassius gibelio]XP_052403043.1 LON peptidase N-terminal domain and RING finger protein 2 isoform X2 [Carassius gibelio]
MDAGIQNHTEHYLHDPSNPTAPGLCAEMLGVADEACRAGDFDLAAEIYTSQLAELEHPDRGLCLRKADALARGGRIADALDSYCVAANLQALRPDELQILVEVIAHTIRTKEQSDRKTISGGSTFESRCFESDELDDEQNLDLFSCHVCKCLLTEPTSLVCGHTFCKCCLEDDLSKECRSCRLKPNKSPREFTLGGLRVNVIASGLIEKWFNSESKARRYWLEGEGLWKKQDVSNAILKFNKAIELEPCICQLLARRAELLMEMKNFGQAIKDGDTMCLLRPQWPKAHYIKATAFRSTGRNEEALQEYFYCLALKFDWIAVKLEAQKILSHMFSSVFANNGLATSMQPLPVGSTSRIKPSSLLSSLHSSLPRDGVKAGCSKEATLNCSKFKDENSSILQRSENVNSVGLSSLFVQPVLKRKWTEDVKAFEPPRKQLKEDKASSRKILPTFSGGRQVQSQLLDSADFECSLCMRLFYEPVTTPCGHTFCLKCLERCLDHNPNCPLCKENLSEYLATRAYNKTLLIEKLLQHFFCDELAERRKVHEEEMKELSNLNQEVPIFVCTIAFPTVPCPLHVFEPRYRLMIRRSMETGTKQFGMCIADELNGFADHGCMLEVRDVKLFPDGRSVVDTIGIARFRVVTHGQRDGYNTAKIEYLEDKKVEGEEFTELLKLHDSVYDQALGWFTSLKDDMKNQIISHFGQLPVKDSDPQDNPNGPAWCWWLLAVLPLENKAQLTILAMNALKDRLIAIRRVLIFVTRKRPR